MINKIDGPAGPGSIRSTTGVRRPAKTGATSGPAFAKHLDADDEVEGTAATSGAGGVNSVAGMIGLQEVDDALARASKGKLRAQDILDRLEEMRMELLTGTLTKSKLMKLAQMVHSRRQEVTDPHLGEILDEIDLRAQVELAKYGPGSN